MTSKQRRRRKQWQIMELGLGYSNLKHGSMWKKTTIGFEFH